MSSSFWLLLILLVSFLGLAITRAYKTPLKAYTYFKTREGKGVLFGILMAIISIVGTAFSDEVFSAPHSGPFDNLKYFQYGEVYGGLDQTFKSPSPQCQSRGSDPKTTSNLGFRVNLLQSYDNKVSLDTKYTHHSCAFSPDRNTYDALGLELNWRIWGN